MADVIPTIETVYPEDTPFRRMLILHSTQVRDKALEILEASPLKEKLDRELVIHGAMLHDIGIGACHAPSILCTGNQPYIAHGIIGAQMLRGMNPHLEPFARICERHTGAGLTAANIRQQNLPLPVDDYLPETPEEKLICLADKFFSKSGDMKEKSFARVRQSLEKFGEDTLERFDGMCSLFGLIR